MTTCPGVCGRFCRIRAGATPRCRLTTPAAVQCCSTHGATPLCNKKNIEPCCLCESYRQDLWRVGRLPLLSLQDSFQPGGRIESLRLPALRYSYMISWKKKLHPFFSQNALLRQDWLTVLPAFQLGGRMQSLRLTALRYCYMISWELQAGSVMCWPSPSVIGTGFI